MRVLLDNCVDVRFGDLLVGHEVIHARDLGWQGLSNGKLLEAAERADFRVLITVDKNIRHQQNVAKRTVSLLTLAPLFTAYDKLVPLTERVLIVLATNLPAGSDIVVRSEDASPPS